MDFSNVTVLCAGDVMLDRYVYGDIERISPEAPVPVLRLTRTTEMLGGAGNVANNIAALGGRAILVGLLGADDAAGGIRALVDGVPGIEPAFVETPHRPTICKSRFVASRQQIVRTDQEGALPQQDHEVAALRRSIEHAIARAQAVLLSDY